MFNRIRCASIVFIILGIGFLVSSILLFVLGDSLIQKAVKKECQLRPGTVVYNLWRDSPVPLYISIYVFDLGNDTEFLNGTAKPRLKQRGPFVYKEERPKEDVREYENGTISYREPRRYTFDPLRSSESETVNITTLNIVYMTLVNYLQMEHVPNIARRIIGELLSIQEKPLVRYTVKEYLWGYQDALLHILKEELPELVKDDQVSAFYAAINGIELNTILINNGVGLDANNNERINDVGHIERFNFTTNLTNWSNQYANMINGTDSTIWHPSATRTERIYSFIPDICRSLYLEFNESRQNSFNIDNYRYTLPNSVFENLTENEGFCFNSTTLNKTHELECLPSGLFSLKTCIHLSGSSVPIPLPIIASNPHFLGADPLVQNAVIGLSPDEIKHRSYVDVEPVTGIVMNGSRRLQINIQIVNDSTLDAIARVNPLVYPMIWIDEHAEIDKPNANTFYKKVTMPITILHTMKYVLLGLGIALFIIVIVLLAYNRHKTKIYVPVFPKSSTDETSPLIF